MGTITVEGFDFTTSEHTNAAESGVYVYDNEGELIGAAFLDHNAEQGHADFEDRTSPINYWDFANKPLEELATWVAGVYWQ